MLLPHPYYRNNQQLKINATLTLGNIDLNLGNSQQGIINYKKAAVLGHKGIQDWLKKNGHEW